jgi:hypothetical protein
MQAAAVNSYPVEARQDFNQRREQYSHPSISMLQTKLNRYIELRHGKPGSA